jgi:hypothetical protein
VFLFTSYLEALVNLRCDQLQQQSLRFMESWEEMIHIYDAGGADSNGSQTSRAEALDGSRAAGLGPWWRRRAGRPNTGEGRRVVRIGHDGAERR